MSRPYGSISIVTALTFVATVLSYIVFSAYLGHFFIGAITGICCFVQLTMFFFSVKDILKHGFHWKLMFFLLVEGFSLIGMGYFFLIWLLVI